jgi:glycosyltransferase involved in cell wall biosynthesis
VPPKELHSIVVPMFNEEQVAEAFFARLMPALAPLPSFEVVVVDDGSRDRTPGVLSDLAANDPRIRVVRLARNFGHQTAITAGIDMASGDTVTVIDADLQDPPELIPDMVALWRGGADIVFAIRERRRGEGLFKRLSAAFFYRMIRTLARADIPLDAGDYRLMSRRAVAGLGAMRERSRYIRGLVGWMGLRRATVTYAREERAAGKTKYPLSKMVRLAVDGIVSFSSRPLQIATWIGFATSALGMVLAALAVADWVGGHTVQGWTSLMIVVLLFGGVQLLTLGIVGAYVGRIYAEILRRPLYFVDTVTNFPPQIEEHFAESCLPDIGDDRPRPGPE